MAFYEEQDLLSMGKRMPEPSTDRFHPKRWTPLTWLAVLLWAWNAIPLNYPPSAMYTVESATGELSAPTRYNRLSEIPFPVGWPLHYVTPSYLTTPVAPVMPVGAPAPPPVPSRVSPLAMVANLLLIVVAISALVYCLQKAMPRYSLSALFLLTLAVSLYFALGRLLVILVGFDALWWYDIVVYFSPIAAALALRYSVFQRVKWSRLRLKERASPRHFDDYDNPDDALAAASKLDRNGDWNGSVNLYRLAAERWPEHGEYIQKCIDRVTEKISLAQS